MVCLPFLVIEKTISQGLTIENFWSLDGMVINLFSIARGFMATETGRVLFTHEPSLDNLKILLT
jgi:hypothetical protein